MSERRMAVGQWVVVLAVEVTVVAIILGLKLIPRLDAGQKVLNGAKLGCGHPTGPLGLCDLIGLDVLYAICDALYGEFKRSEYAPPPLLKRMLVTGWLGRKSDRGFYHESTGRLLTLAASEA